MRVRGGGSGSTTGNKYPKEMGSPITPGASWREAAITELSKCKTQPTHDPCTAGRRGVAAGRRKGRHWQPVSLFCLFPSWPLPPLLPSCYLRDSTFSFSNSPADTNDSIAAATRSWIASRGPQAFCFPYAAARQGWEQEQRPHRAWGQGGFSLSPKRSSRNLPDMRA